MKSNRVIRLATSEVLKIDSEKKEIIDTVCKIENSSRKKITFSESLVLFFHKFMRFFHEKNQNVWLRESKVTRLNLEF